MSINVSNYTGTIGGLTVNSGIKLVQTGMSLGLSTIPLSQGTNSVNIISGTGAFSASAGSTVFIGSNCGLGPPSVTGNFGFGAIAIGLEAGQVGYNNDSVSIGYRAGNTNMPGSGIAIGTRALETNTVANGIYSIGIGWLANLTNAANYSTCINSSSFASTASVANTIILNSGSSSVNPASSGFFVQPVASRAAGVGVNRLMYDPSTKEIYYSTT